MRAFLGTLAKLLLAATMFWVGSGFVEAADAPLPAGAVRLDSLRGGTPVDQDNAPAASHQERDHAPMARDFVQQPPLIPHTTAGYQVTKNFNKCMDCHGWGQALKSRATKVSVTHFKNREGSELDNISPRRYFCTQCHVPQTDAKPLVENTFQRARGLQ